MDCNDQNRETTKYIADFGRYNSLSGGGTGQKWFPLPINRETTKHLADLAC
jgi:hypothetical protein